MSKLQLFTSLFLTNAAIFDDFQIHVLVAPYNLYNICWKSSGFSANNTATSACKYMHIHIPNLYTVSPMSSQKLLIKLFRSTLNKQLLFYILNVKPFSKYSFYCQLCFTFSINIHSTMHFQHRICTKCSIIQVYFHYTYRVFSI